MAQQCYQREQERANTLQTQLSDSQIKLAESEKESREQALNISELKQKNEQLIQTTKSQ